GMKVPVTIEVDSKKHYEITVGSPPTSALITKEAGAKKGGAHQLNDTMGNLSMDQVKKLAEMKLDALTSTSLYSAAREIVGTCNSMAITVDGKRAKEVQQEFRDGRWDEFFGKTKKQTFSEKAKGEVAHLKEEAKKAIVKTEVAIEKAIEEIEVAIEHTVHPKKTEKKAQAAEKSPEPIAEKKADEKAQAMKQEVPAEKTDLQEVEEESEALLEEVAQEPMPQKESYTQHMAKIEKEVGVVKKEPQAKKTQTEVVKSDSNSEIIRPKKAQK
ncbi:MAG: hypothetical protein NUV67_04485, partial [archaeon]|nr:hypothetical protein [archaeon]